MFEDWMRNLEKKLEPVVHHDGDLGELMLDCEGKWCGTKYFNSLQHEVDFGIVSKDGPPSLRHKDVLRTIENNCDSILRDLRRILSEGIVDSEIIEIIDSLQIEGISLFNFDPEKFDWEVLCRAIDGHLVTIQMEGFKYQSYIMDG